MELLINGSSISHQPSDLDITNALSEFAAGEHEFIVLDNPEQNMLAQVARGGDGAYILEVIDHQLGSTLCSAEHFIDSGTVSNVFLSILEGDQRWKSETQWVTVETGAPVDTAAQARALILFFAILAAAILAGVVAYVSQSG